MENVYIISKFIQETVQRTLSESPESYRRYYKNILVSFFQTQCIVVVTSVKEVMSCPAFVCLITTLYGLNVGTTELIFVKILPQMYLWTGKN